MQFGDYQINEDTIFERKSYADFCHSITDGRLFRQAEALSKNFKNPIIILEGGPGDARNQRERDRLLPRDSVLGAALSVVISFGVAIVPTLSQADTARLLLRAAERDGKPPSSYRVTTTRKAKNCEELRRQMLEIFPGIGAKTAEKVAAMEFPLIEILKCLASGREVPGLSEKQQRKAWEVLNKC